MRLLINKWFNAPTLRIVTDFRRRYAKKHPYIPSGGSPTSAYVTTSVAYASKYSLRSYFGAVGLQRRSGFSKHTETLVQEWGGFKHSEDMGYAFKSDKTYTSRE